MEAALDGGVLHPVARPVIVHREGSHWLAVATRGTDGERSAIRWIHIIVDATPPAVTLDMEPEPVMNRNTAWVPGGDLVRAAATDALSGLAVMTLDVGKTSKQASSSPVTATLKTEGAVTVTATARDRAGNSSAPVTRQVTVDITPPQLALKLTPAVTARGDVTIGGPHAAIVASAHDTGSGLGPVSYKLDGHTVPASRLRGPWAEGAHTLAMTAADLVGNPAMKTLAFTIDATPPVVRCTAQETGVAGRDGGTWYRPGVHVLCTATDAASGVAALAWRHGDASWTPLTGPVALTSGIFQTRATDRVGNHRVRRWTFPVDGTAPQMAAVLPGGTRLSPGQVLAVPLDVPVHVTVQDNGSGVASAKFQVNEGSWAPLPDHIVFRNGQVFELGVRACDELGNCATAHWPVQIAASHQAGR